jgi:hypothetical protein
MDLRSREVVGGFRVLLTKIALVGAMLLALLGAVILIDGSVSAGLTLIGIAGLTLVMCFTTISINRRKE